MKHRFLDFFSFLLMGLLGCCVLAVVVLWAMPVEIWMKRVILPLGMRFFSPDGIIDPSTLDLMSQSFAVLKIIFLISVCGFVVYVLLWFWGTVKLPERRSSKAVYEARKFSMISAAVSEWAFLSGILLIAVLLRIPGMSRGFYYDEMFSFAHFISGKTFWQTISSYIQFNNHIGYSVFAKIFIYFLGPAEWVLRLPALIFGILSLAVFAGFLRARVSRLTVFAMTATMAVLPWHAEFSVSARGYSAMLFFALLSTGYFFRVMTSARFWDAVGYVVSTVLGVFFHLYFVFIVAIQMIFLAGLLVAQLIKKPSVQYLSRESFCVLWMCFFIAGFLFKVLYFPAIPGIIEVLMRSMRQSSGMGFLIFQSIFNLFAGGMPTWGMTGFFLPLGMVGFIVSAIMRPREWVYMTYLLIIPPVLMAALNPSDLHARFFVFTFPFLLVFTAFGFDYFQNQYLRLRGLPQKVCLGIFISVFFGFLFFGGKSSVKTITTDIGYRSAVQLVNARVNHKNDGVACAIGDLAPIFMDFAQYYSNYSVALPYSMEDVLSLLKSHSVVYCFFVDGRAWSDSHHEIYAYFIRYGRQRCFGSVCVLELNASDRQDDGAL